MNKPRWLLRAEKYLGVKEVPGKGNNPLIVDWLIRLRAWWRDDLQPWCGTFAGICLTEAGIAPPKAWYRAKAYLDYGQPLTAPVYGCIVVFGRTGGGHVGFIVGRDERGRLLVLGGNQSDAVNVAPFEPARVLGYRWPPGVPVERQAPPIMTASGASSSNEA